MCGLGMGEDIGYDLLQIQHFLGVKSASPLFFLLAVCNELTGGYQNWNCMTVEKFFKC
jgi:hypothetical protein